MASSRGRSNSDRWEKGFAALSRFRAREGHCCPPRFHVEGNFNLGPWVSTQRSRKDFLPLERKRRLETIGFVWDWIDYRWEQGFKALSIAKEITDLDGGFPRSANVGKNCQPNRRPD